MKALITGGVGFIGAQLARALLDRGVLSGVTGEEEAIESLLDKGLTGLARNRLERARRHWPDNPVWDDWEARLTAEE